MPPSLPRRKSKRSTRQTASISALRYRSKQRTSINGDQSDEQARAGIEAALAELERGEPFAEVAGRHSDCKDNGGDLWQFPAGAIVEDFEQAIRALEPGLRTGIFRTPFGFHIAELRARPAPGPAAFDDVRADIERVLAFGSEHQVYMRKVAELRSHAEVRWVPEPEVAANRPSAIAKMRNGQKQEPVLAPIYEPITGW